VSKASEWAKASAAVSKLDAGSFECNQVPTFSNENPRPVSAAVGHKNGEAMLCLTDGRLGGTYLDNHNALALALWIIATFSDKATTA
jgi:hypothetical protein